MLNRSIVRFLAILLGVYAGWFLLYEGWLLPNGTLDEYLSLAVAEWAAAWLSLFGQSVEQAGRVVGVEGARGLIVENGCNGLEALGLFVGFVLAYPGSWKRRAWFIPLGLALIVAVGTARIAFLGWIQVALPQWFDLFHNFAITSFFYLVIFALWIVWANISGHRPADSENGGAEVAAEPAWSA